MNFPYTAPFFGSIICLEFTICKGNPIRENCCSWKVECVKFLLVESGILGFGIRNTAQVIRNPTNDWSLESKFHLQRLKSSTWNPESMAWNPESKTVLDSLTWANEWLTFPREGCLPFLFPEFVYRKLISLLTGMYTLFACRRHFDCADS